MLVVEFPDEQSYQEALQRGLSKFGVVLSDDEALELLYTIGAQTILHEGTHALIDSKPGSIFAKALEKGGFENQEGRDSTLLDEGLTYAIQNYFAPNNEKLGKLVVQSYSLEQLKDEPDPEIKKVQKRKYLGNILTPLVSEYFDGGRNLDEEFFERAFIYLAQVLEL
ncbi:MAG TPA: hypothetical protein PKX78_03275 [Candidatus Woesebacteria bacterium]|nr:hypothetical protein [Candidatus Woesebacteria bacterium]